MIIRGTATLEQPAGWEGDVETLMEGEKREISFFIIIIFFIYFVFMHFFNKYIPTTYYALSPIVMLQITAMAKTMCKISS